MIDLIVLACSLVAAIPLICRISAFDYRHHTWRISVLHALMACAVSWSAVKACQGQADFGNLFAVLASLSWVWISFHSWKNGVPAHFHKHQPSDDLHVLDFSALDKAWGRGTK